MSRFASIVEERHQRSLTRRAPSHQGQAGARTPIGKMTITQLLVQLGFDPKSVYCRRPGGGTFWERNNDVLDIAYREAREGWTKRLQEAHPDRPGGCHEEAARLNRIWDRTRKLFRSHGIDA